MMTPEEQVQVLMDIQDKWRFSLWNTFQVPNPWTAKMLDWVDALKQFQARDVSAALTEVYRGQDSVKLPPVKVVQAKVREIMAARVRVTAPTVARTSLGESPATLPWAVGRILKLREDLRDLPPNSARYADIRDRVDEEIALAGKMFGRGATRRALAEKGYAIAIPDIAAVILRDVGTTETTATKTEPAWVDEVPF